MNRIIATCAGNTALLAVVVALTPGPALAQWVAPEGEGSFSIEIQRRTVGEHLWSDLAKARGMPPPEYAIDTTDVSVSLILLSADYTIRERLSMGVSLPFLRTELRSGIPEEGHNSADLSSNYGFQDLKLSVRYQILTQPLFATINAQVNVPTHDYSSHGHAAIGRNLRSVSLGVGAGRTLSPWIDGVFVQGRYSYTRPESLGGMNLHHSGISLALTWLPPVEALSVTAWSNQRIAHGGIDWSDPGWETNDWWPIHDRITAEDSVVLGGTASYGLIDNLSVYVGYYRTLEGLSQNTQQQDGFSLGTTTSF